MQLFLVLFFIATTTCLFGGQTDSIPEQIAVDDAMDTMLKNTTRTLLPFLNTNLGQGAVRRLNIFDQAVDNRCLADNAVTATKIANSAVTTNSIAAGAVTTACIATSVGTQLNTPGTLVKRGTPGGNFAGGIITAEKGFVASAGGATITGLSTLNGNITSTGFARFTGLRTQYDATITGTLYLPTLPAINLLDAPATYYGLYFNKETGQIAGYGSSDTLVTISSRKFKDDIKDIGETSQKLMQLRPVSFSYKADKNHDTRYGLIAEEAAEILPHLVGFDENNQPIKVHYHYLAPLLLNEYQKQEKRLEIIESLVTMLNEKTQTIDEMKQRLQALEEALNTFGVQ